MMAGMIASGAIQMKISPNIWVMINTLQILRTILLLKINLPQMIRQTIISNSMISGLDLGLSGLIVPELDENTRIMKIMDSDELLDQYFKEYGIETFRFLDFAIESFINVILLFIFFTLLMSGIYYLFLKYKKKETSIVKEKLKDIFYINGFLRIYMEILLDGILYIFINLRSLLFINILDAFSYILLLAFALLIICFTLFLISYSRGTEMMKWSSKIHEILTETSKTKGGVLVYHLTFILRRVGITLNVIMLGAFDPNIHITIHVLIQVISCSLMVFYPMFESRFQKGNLNLFNHLVSNLIMEISILFIFASAYIFHNSHSIKDEAEILVIIIIFGSQLLIMIMTISKAIRDIILKQKEKKNKVNNFRLPIQTQILNDKNTSKVGLNQSGVDSLVKSKVDLKEDANLKVTLKGFEGINEEVKE